MNDADIVIVGAGLTGLRAGLEVNRAGFSVLIVDKNPEVGGRMRTSSVRGCLLDHGFQVVLTGYPLIRSLPFLSNLHLRSFWSGARVRTDSDFYDFLDPRRHPLATFSVLRSPIASLLDLLRLLAFVECCSSESVRPKGIQTATALDSAGFTEIFKGAFLKPFLRGVLLDPALSTDIGLSRFYLKMFSRGHAALPATGIQALPNALADALGREHVLLNSTVTHVKPDRVVLQSGDEIRAKRVICAVDALSAAALGGPAQTCPHYNVATLYFLAEHPPYREPLLTLNGDGRGPINSMTVLSNVQPSYAPEGTALISVSVLGDEARRPVEQLRDLVRHQLHDWFGPQVVNWEYLHSFQIANALPARPRFLDSCLQENSVLYAGDYLFYGSQNGALAAGIAAAREVLT